MMSRAPNDCFLLNAFKRCFRLSGVLLKLCRLILGCSERNVSVRLFDVNSRKICPSFLSISRNP